MTACLSWVNTLPLHSHCPKLTKQKQLWNLAYFWCITIYFLLPLTACLLVSTQMPVPPTLKNKAGIMGAPTAGHALGSCLVSLYNMSHFHLPQTRQKNSANTVELGPKEAVWIAIIQFSGERELINIQVSPRHQMFSFNRQILWSGRRVMLFWVAFSSRVISDAAVVFVNGNHESGVLLWRSLRLQTGSKLHPVWSTRVLEAWVCSNSQVSILSQFKPVRELNLSSFKQFG